MNEPIRYHIIPLHDIDSHIEDVECPCKPSIISQGPEKTEIIMHNAFDGSDREIIARNHLELNRQQLN